MQREVRVHGVSGTRPRDILYTDPITISPPDGPTKIYQKQEYDPGFDTVAFHWANLTSGSKLTALWILLAPYALANAAGWMSGWRRDPVPGTSHRYPTEPWHDRFGRLAIRAAGLAITALFVVQAFTAVVLLPLTWLEQSGEINWGPIEVSFDGLSQRPAITALVLVVGGVFFWLVAYVSTRSHFTEQDLPGIATLLLGTTGNAMGEEQEDPAGAVVSDPKMWTVHTMLHRLRRLHLGMGLLTLGLIVAVVTGWLALSAAMGTILVTALFGSWMTTYLPQEHWVWVLTSWTPVIALVLLVVPLVSIWMADPVAWQMDTVHGFTFGVAAILGVFVALALAAGPLSVGALVLAAFFGGVLGTTIGLVVDKALDTNVLIDHGVGSVAVVMLALIVWLALAAVVASLFGYGDPARGATKPLPGSSKLQGLVRRITLEIRVLFYAAGVFGLVSFVYGLALIWAHGSEQGGDGSVWSTLVGGLEPAALDQYPNWLINLGIAVAILGPGYFALRSIVTGWRGGRRGEDRRRKVGILWDLGSFWPRWFHPLAPPGYGPRAVTDLTKELQEGPGMILAAHSQGSLISAVSIALADTPTRFITYGSQLGILYPRMFPDVGIPDLVDHVAGKCPIWINLWRDTDYIGGHFVSHGGVTNRRVAEGKGHSGYELTVSYRHAREEIAGT